MKLKLIGGLSGALDILWLKAIKDVHKWKWLIRFDFENSRFKIAKWQSDGLALFCCRAARINIFCLRSRDPATASTVVETSFSRPCHPFEAWKMNVTSGIQSQIGSPIWNWKSDGAAKAKPSSEMKWARVEVEHVYGKKSEYSRKIQSLIALAHHKEERKTNSP
jgi:hypothetical protein